MLEKPDIPDERILAALRHDFGLQALRIDFLPLGADENAAAYRVVARDASPYFLKLRQGVFDETSVVLPSYLRGQGVAAMIAKRGQILDLTDRSERLAQALQSRSPQCVLCHSDLHAGNVLIDVNGAIYIVDWDNPILAPKERDLMFVGGAQGYAGRTAQEEEALFYRGYGEAHIDPRALAYYRYERIIEDIAAYCQQLLSTDEGGQDRKQSLRYVMSNFMPNGTIAVAYESDRALTEGWR